jgi:hypothetical protein
VSQPTGAQATGAQATAAQPGNGSGGGQPDGAAAGTGTATDEPPLLHSQPPPPPPEKRRLKRSTRVGVLIIVVLALIAAGAFTASYVLDARHYVSTDNAQVDGDKISVNAPASGTVIDWRGTLGSQLVENEVVGRIKITGGFVQPQQSIRAPADGPWRSTTRSRGRTSRRARSSRRPTTSRRST